MPGPIDWLVLTAANRRQAKAYASQLAMRGERGALRKARGMLVVPDAHERRIGSGAATVLALVQVARQMLQRKRVRSFGELFAGERVLMLHSGGDSRRLPMYAAEGKLFASVPVHAAGARCGTVFDVLLADLLTLPPRAGGEVLVAAGDAVLGIARETVRFDGAGVIGVAQRADIARAMRHGVFVCGAGGEEVASFLQKPSEAELRAAGAIGPDARALVDTGLLSFDPASIAALLAGAGVEITGSGEIALVRGGLADLASRGASPVVDLYREILMALPAPTMRESYLAACAPGALHAPLAALFDAMRGTSFRVKTAALGEFLHGEFLHIGSTREMLESLVGAHASARAFGLAASSVPCAPDSVAGNGELLVLDSSVEQAVIAQGRAVIDRSALVRAELAGDNLVVGVEMDGVLALPRGVSLFALPVHEQVDALVCCGLRDDFKTRLDAGGTLLDMPFEAFARRAGIEAGECIAGDGTLWDARLWCAAGSDDPLARVRWMWEGLAAPDEWRAAPRISLRELVEHADLEEIA